MLLKSTENKLLNINTKIKLKVVSSRKIDAFNHLATALHYFIEHTTTAIAVDWGIRISNQQTIKQSWLSYDVASGSVITPCNKIDKPLVVYRFTGNVMTSITTLRS